MHGSLLKRRLFDRARVSSSMAAGSSNPPRPNSIRVTPANRAQRPRLGSHADRTRQGAGYALARWPAVGPPGGTYMPFRSQTFN